MLYFKKIEPKGTNQNLDDPVVVAIAKEMEDALQERGVWDYSKVYVGITNNPRERLFVEHNVDEYDDVWVVYETCDKAIAEKVEAYLLRLGMKGAPGGGNDRSVYVYCYEITPSTLQ